MTVLPVQDKLKHYGRLKRVLSIAERPTDCCSAAAPIHRRRFLRWGLLAASAFFLPRQAGAAAREATSPERRLAFFNTHTGESLDACYFKTGCYDPNALRAINHILRDHRSGEVGPINERLLDLLHALSRRCEHPRPFHVISGYRSPATNAALHACNRGVAAQSLHVYGKAIDIRVRSVSSRRISAIAAA